MLGQVIRRGKQYAQRAADMTPQTNCLSLFYQGSHLICCAPDIHIAAVQVGKKPAYRVKEVRRGKGAQWVIRVYRITRQ